MAKITRIKAGEPSEKAEKVEKPKKPAEKPKAAKAVVKNTDTEKTVAVKKIEKATAVKKVVASEESNKKKAGEKKPFILIRPFVALWRYLKASWAEIRQVRWPNRKATWKMVLAVFIYTALFAVMITLLDMLFSFIFNLILK